MPFETHALLSSSCVPLRSLCIASQKENVLPYESTPRFRQYTDQRFGSALHNVRQSSSRRVVSSPRRTWCSFWLSCSFERGPAPTALAHRHIFLVSPVYACACDIVYFCMLLNQMCDVGTQSLVFAERLGQRDEQRFGRCRQAGASARPQERGQWRTCLPPTAGSGTKQSCCARTRRWYSSSRNILLRQSLFG